MQKIERYPPMDKESQFIVFLTAVFGVAVSLLIRPPKRVMEAIIGVLAGFFGAMVVAPAVAEILTNIAGVFPSLSWLKATPGTALFAAIIGIGGMAGLQIVLYFNKDFIRLIEKLTNIRIRINGDDDRK